MKLPVIERPIDNTALTAYTSCPREYNLSMRQGWRPKEKSQALSFGAFWHRLMETHYKTGGDLNAVLTTFNDYQHEVPDTGDYRTAGRALVEYKRYRKEYDIAKDCATTVGFPEAPMVEISTAIASDSLVHEYAGKIDRIVIENGLGWVEDHKTTSRLDKYYFQQFELANQMMGYVWMAKQLVPDIKIVGARINLMHILTSKSAFHRHPVTFSDKQIEEWEANTNNWLRRLARDIEADDFPGHFGDNGCNRRYGRCVFFNVCSSMPSIREAVLQQDFHIDHWDPLALGDD